MNSEVEATLEKLRSLQDRSPQSSSPSQKENGIMTNEVARSSSTSSHEPVPNSTQRKTDIVRPEEFRPSRFEHSALWSGLFFSVDLMILLLVRIGVFAAFWNFVVAEKFTTIRLSFSECVLIVLFLLVFLS